VRTLTRLLVYGQKRGLRPPTMPRQSIGKGVMDDGDGSLAFVGLVPAGTETLHPYQTGSSSVYCHAVRNASAGLVSPVAAPHFPSG
jgi:hypothetical protein